MDQDLSLFERRGLPEPLRVLMQDYPREMWESDPHFHGLVSFWLDRHVMFRRLLSAMTAATEDVLEAGNPNRFSNAISRYGSMFINDLHGHHQIEDLHYFPILSQKDNRISRGFDILEKDHQSMDGILHSFATVANNALKLIEQPTDLRDAAGALHKELDTLTGLMDRHLTDEEELIVPVILKFGESGLQ